jgi:hypothetical protein
VDLAQRAKAARLVRCNRGFSWSRSDTEVAHVGSPEEPDELAGGGCDWPRYGRPTKYWEKDINPECLRQIRECGTASSKTRRSSRDGSGPSGGHHEGSLLRSSLTSLLFRIGTRPAGSSTWSGIAPPPFHTVSRLDESFAGVTMQPASPNWCAVALPLSGTPPEATRAAHDTKLTTTNRPAIAVAACPTFTSPLN